MITNRKCIALCTSRIYDHHTHEFIETLNERFRPAGVSLLVFTLNSDLYWQEIDTSESAIFDLIPYEMIDAVILMDERIKSHTISEKIIRNSRARHLPVLVVDGHYDGVPSINFDYGKGFEQVVRHVIEHHGAKNPHMIAGIPGNTFSDERIDIFRRVLQENGLPFNDQMVSHGLFWATPAREAMQKVLDSGALPDAVICANDIMAINACDVLKKNGISVPEQVLVSGFDGYDEVFITSPKITTANCNSFAFADATADAALKILSGEAFPGTLITPELIPNESCGCPSFPMVSNALMDHFNDGFYRYQDDIRMMYDISTSMQVSRTPEELVLPLKHDIMKDLLFAVDRRIFDPAQNYLLSESGNLDPDNLCLVFDAEAPDQSKVFSRPVPERISELLSCGYPLIFNCLDFMNKPLGYVCFYFRSYEITDYSKMPSVTNIISMGLGGYINLHYQRWMAEKMDEMYRRDALTGLYNRIGFHAVFDQLSAKEENTGRPVTVIMADLDGLKYINDNFGHAEGDNAISVAAHALRDACPANAIPARFGGDEFFAVVIGDCDIDDITRRIDEILSEYNASSGKPYRINSSCGAITGILNPDFDLGKALHLADEKMYEIKRAKKQSSE